MITLYGDWQANTVVICATTLAVSLAVLVHYEGLALISNWLTKRRELHSRRKVLYSIFSIIRHNIMRNIKPISLQDKGEFLFINSRKYGIAGGVCMI
jgi:hypothetical protein